MGLQASEGGGTLNPSLRELITEVVKGMWLKDKHKALKFVPKSTVYEDNSDAIRVASCPKVNPT
eukprot:7662739-Ditylum_brightwellii.AAC.1